MEQLPGEWLLVGASVHLGRVCIWVECAVGHVHGVGSMVVNQVCGADMCLCQLLYTPLQVRLSGLQGWYLYVGWVECAWEVQLLVGSGPKGCMVAD